MKGEKKVKINNKVYHIKSPFAEPEYGTIVKIKAYNPNLKNGYLVTIVTTEGKTITDYITNFTKEFPAICNYWN